MYCSDLLNKCDLRAQVCTECCTGARQKQWKFQPQPTAGFSQLVILVIQIKSRVGKFDPQGLMTCQGRHHWVSPIRPHAPVLVIPLGFAPMNITVFKAKHPTYPSIEIVTKVAMVWDVSSPNLLMLLDVSWETTSGHRTSDTFYPPVHWRSPSASPGRPK